MDGRRRALLSVPFGYASLHCEQGTPIPLANDLQLFNFRWQSLFKFGWQWTHVESILLEDAAVTILVRFCQVATRYGVPETEELSLAAMGLHRHNQIA